MDTVIRGLFVYLFLLIVLRLSGKRSLSQMTTFDFVLTLILSETVQQAMIDNDNSLTNGALLVITLIGFDILLSQAKRRYPAVAKLIDSTPVVIIKEGEILKGSMDGERVSEEDILEAARENQGISRLNLIDYAVVEENGHITIIPKRRAR